MSTYSFLNVQAALSGPGGSFSIGASAGVAEEGITAEMAEDKDTATTGADGSLMHSLHAGNTGTITVRLLKTSPVNAKLSQLYNFQRQGALNWGQNTIVVSDPARGDVVNGSQMAFARQPSVTWAKDGNFNEWRFTGIVIEQLGAGVPDINT